MADVLTILVVDDSPAMRAILGAILGAAGHEVMLAESVEVGVGLHRLWCPDLVLTDFTMPGGTGLDLVERLRADGFDRPVFVVSSERDPEIQTAMARAGADAWFPKPVCAATLLQAVEGVRRDAINLRPSSERRSPAPAIRFG